MHTQKKESKQKEMISILKKLIPAIFIIITAIAMSFASSTKKKESSLASQYLFLFLSVHFSVKRLSEMKETRGFHATSNLGMGI